VRQVWLKKLGLFGNPTLEQIKKAYRKLALIHHPDRLAGASDSVLKESQERMREIVEAHHALVRPDNYCGTDGSEASGSYTE
jgi:DnaJ-class molecular chaperone